VKVPCHTFTWAETGPQVANTAASNITARAEIALITLPHCLNSQFA
jgi:hypothetical protein